MKRMTKITLKLPAELNKRLKQRALDDYGTMHGVQQEIIKNALDDWLTTNNSDDDIQMDMRDTRTVTFELNDELNKRLKQFALDNYEVAHGKQQHIIRNALSFYLDDLDYADKAYGKDAAAQPQENIKEEKEALKADQKVKKPKEQKKKHVPITDADKEYLKDYFKTHRIADAKWTEIGKGMNPVRAASTVKTAVEGMIKRGELKREEPETANVGE